MNRAATASILVAMAAPAAGCLVLPETPVENRDRQPLEIEHVNIAEGDRDLPRDTSIEVRFNQPLDPGTLDEAVLGLASGSLTVSADVRYDALTRTLVLDPRYPLREDLWYTFTMDEFPLSIMGTAYLGEPVEIAFRTGTTSSPTTPRPGVSFEEDVWPLLRGCACHDRETHYMDYVIVHDRPDDFLEQSVATASREWRDWLIVDPGHHESSYLIYKLLGDERLGMPTIMGETMPPGAPMSIEDITTVRDWIEQGAGP